MANGILITTIIFILILTIGTSLFFVTRTASPNLPDNVVDFCGNEICESFEDALSCSTDCGPPIPVCGNNICEHRENIIECPQDCQEELGLIPTQINKCGDEICQQSETRTSCPIDCGVPDIDLKTGVLCPQGILSQCFDNEILKFELNRKERPLKQGTVLHIDYGENQGVCTIGAILQSQGKNYILTAGHCITNNENQIPDSQDLNRLVEQENSDNRVALDNVVGKVKKFVISGNPNVALIEIESGIPFSLKSFLDDDINGFTAPEIGMRVFKVGRTTGLTEGKIIEIGSNYFVVRGRNGNIFSGRGDSGSAIMTRTDPAQIVGIVNVGLFSGSSDNGLTSRLTVSPLPQNIITSLGL